jgi:hypothetical protein
MDRKRSGARRFLLAVSAILSISLLTVGCECDNAKTPPAPKFTVSSEIDQVRSGPSSASLTLLAVGSSTGLPGGYHVTTDAAGQALITGQSNGSTCTIYVFHDGKLKKSSCDEQTVGNNSCVEQTSAVYKHCKNHLIETSSGTFQVKSSWVSITYLPNLQLSLVIVLEGELSARPVLDIETRKLGNESTVRGGRFWYTAPDENLEEIAQYLQPVPPRATLPLQRIGPLFERLDISPWMEKVRGLAAVDGVPLDGWPEPASLELVYGGGPLEDPRVQEALVQSVPWAELTQDVLGQAVPVWAQLHGDLVDVRYVGVNPDLAQELLAEAGFPEGAGLPEVPVIFVQDDEGLAALAEVTAALLKERGIHALYNPLPADYAWDKLKALIDSDQPALWLGWR